MLAGAGLAPLDLQSDVEGDRVGGRGPSEALLFTHHQAEDRHDPEPEGDRGPLLLAESLPRLTAEDVERMAES